MAAEGGPVGCGASRRRRVRRDGGIPPAGPCPATRFPGRCKHRPLHRFAMSQGCGFPFGRAFAAVCMGGPWTSRGSPRRRNFPVCRRVFRGSVGRAFTPAAPWKFQNRNVCAAAGSGGMGHPALRPPGWRWPSRLAQNMKLIRRGGIYCARRRVSEANRRAAAALRPEIPPGTFAPPRGSRDDASIVPYRGLQCRRVVISRLAGRLPRFVGEGHGPPANPCAAAISRFTAAFSPAP